MTIQTVDNWETMHRQRFVLLANGTRMTTQGDVPILTKTANQQYQPSHFNESSFAREHFDVGLTDEWACIPDCGFYDDVFSIEDPIPFGEHFKDKYLVDLSEGYFAWSPY